MFTSWISRTETKLAFSSTLDVRFDPITKGDNMESFVVSLSRLSNEAARTRTDLFPLSFLLLSKFAETFKYYYLLFADPSELSLDDYVLSTGSFPSFCFSPFSSYSRRDSSLTFPPRFFAQYRGSSLHPQPSSETWILRSLGSISRPREREGRSDRRRNECSKSSCAAREGDDRGFNYYALTGDGIYSCCLILLVCIDISCLDRFTNESREVEKARSCFLHGIARGSTNETDHGIRREKRKEMERERERAKSKVRDNEDKGKKKAIQRNLSTRRPPPSSSPARKRTIRTTGRAVRRHRRQRRKSRSSKH